MHVEAAYCKEAEKKALNYCDLFFISLNLFLF